MEKKEMKICERNILERKERKEKEKGGNKNEKEKDGK